MLCAGTESTCLFLYLMAGLGSWKVVVDAVGTVGAVGAVGAVDAMECGGCEMRRITRYLSR